MVLRHTLLYFLSRGLPGVINFLAIAVYTRLLAPEEYAKYALVIAGISFAYVLFFQWLTYGLVRFWPGYSAEQRETMLGSIAACYLLFLAVTGFLTLLGFVFLKRVISSPELLIIGLFLLWIQSCFNIYLELERVQLSPVRYGIIMLGKSVLSIGLGWYLVAHRSGAYGLLYALMVSLLLPVYVLSFTKWRLIRLKKPEWKMIRLLWRYGLPLTLTLALSYIIYSSDRFQLEWLAGAQATGMYAVAYDFAQQSLVLIMTIVNLSAYPLVVTALERNGLNAAKVQISQNATALFLFALPSTAGMVILAPNLSHLLLGVLYQGQAVKVIPLISFAALLGGVKSYYLDLSFQLGKRTGLQIIPVFIAFTVNFLLNLWTIPHFGVLGAAWTAIVAYLVSVSVTMFLSHQIFPLPFPGKEFLKILSATLVMLAVLWPFAGRLGALALVFQVVFGAIVYGIVLWCMNVSNVRSLLNKWIIKNRAKLTSKPVSGKS